jgi:hypothetical protein
VLLQAGDSDGVAWEVHHVVELDAPERLILSLPLAAKRRRPSRAVRYAAFRRRFGALFPRPLPESIGHCQFVYFDADWTPRLLGERGAAVPAGDDPRTVALRRLAREFKIRWAPRWARASAILVGIFVVGYAVASLTGVTASIDRVDDCSTAGVPRLKALEPPFATSDSAVKRYTRDDCQALEDAHLLADGGKLASGAAVRMRCERYTAALYDYEPTDRRGPRSRWDEVAARYCIAPTAPDPGGARLLQTADEINQP